MRALKNIIKALLVAVLLPVVYGQSTNPPTLLSQPASKTLASGSILFLQVQADGAAPLSFQWYWNFAQIRSATNGILFITNAQPTNTGLYFAYVSNSFGVAVSSVATVTVTNPVVANASIPVTLAWDPNSESDLAGYKLYYWRDGTTNQVLTVDVGNKTNITVQLTAPASTYRFYLTAYNTGSLESQPSAQVSDPTPAYQPNQVSGVNSILK